MRQITESDIVMVLCELQKLDKRGIESLSRLAIGIIDCNKKERNNILRIVK